MTTITYYSGGTGVRAETEIETADGAAILVIDQNTPVTLPVTVYLQTPDGISRDTIEYDGHTVGGVDGAEITCGIIDLLDAIRSGSTRSPGYCACAEPVFDADHDAGCRRCGLPVDFTPAEPQR